MENNTIGIRIAGLRRAQGMTQDQLAGRLGISYQAVSKWENGASCPDIMMLPQLAEIFGVSIDALFGRETDMTVVQNESSAHAPFVGELPWPDDGGLYAVLYRGHRLLGCEGLEGSGAKQIHLSFEAAVNGIKRFFSRTVEQGFDKTYAVELHYEGPVRNLTSSMSVCCENTRIEGNVQAGDGVNCGDVGGGVQAGDGVNCGNVGGNVQAGDGVNCGNVGGDIRAGDSVRCGNVDGDVQAGDAVSCGDVHGDIRCEGDVRCANVGGDVHADGDVYLRRE